MKQKELIFIVEMYGIKSLTRRIWKLFRITMGGGVGKRMYERHVECF